MRILELPTGGVLTYVAREDWDNSGAKRLGHVVPRGRFEGVVVHHTVTAWTPDDRDLTGERSKMRALRTMRPDLGLDVPYSFVVFRQEDPRNVVVCEGRGFERTGAHTAGYNSTRYGVAIWGNTMNDQVTEGMLAGIRWVGSHINSPKATVGHRDVRSASTSCPGDKMYALLPLVQPPFAKDFNTGDDEMTPEQAAMLTQLSEDLGEIRAILAASVEPADLVEWCYRQILGRAPDRPGQASWVDYLNRGGSFVRMVELFRMSPEAQK